MSGNILIFAGTSEGRRLCAALDAENIRATACVATEYGARAMPPLERVNVISGRLDSSEIIELINAGGYGLVVDATHPYAGLVSANARAACEQTGAVYVRLLRGGTPAEGIIGAKDAREAAEYLKAAPGNILLTVGSKELDVFCADPELRSRLAVRVLPSPEALERCAALGIAPAQIIAAQGPFSKAFNAALIEQYRCAFLVTKDSGAAGGVPEKLAAAREAGARTIMIGRPRGESGCSFDETLKIIEGFIRDKYDEKRVFFPFYMSSEGKSALVVGAGNVAARRVGTLLKFRFEITVVAPDVSAEILRHSQNGALRLRKRPFADSDIEGFDIVICASSDRAVNARAGRLARDKGLLVSVADAREECNFRFPAVILGGGVTAAAAGDGGEHGAVRLAADKIRGVLD